eukprot:1143085-Amphidinium_carterae.1
MRGLGVLQHCRRNPHERARGDPTQCCSCTHSSGGNTDMYALVLVPSKQAHRHAKHTVAHKRGELTPLPPKI